MQSLQLLPQYFSNLSEIQTQQFSQLIPLYKSWNEKINLISRTDIENLEERHILHALSIALFTQFEPKTKILDLGTGGGFPGIPLAIFFPEVQFHLVDSIGKKIKVVEDITKQLNLKNVTFAHIRAEKVKGEYDFVVTRAVARMKKLYNWTRPIISKRKTNNNLRNGWICLKGGDLREEIIELNKKVELTPLKNYFNLPFFETKYIAYFKQK